MKAPVLAPIALALAVLFVAGCGRGTATVAEYTQTVRSARDRVDAALAQVHLSQSENDLFSRLNFAADVSNRASDDLDHARVAKGFGEETDRLAKALHQLAIDLEATVEQLQDPTFGNVLLHTQALRFNSLTTANRILRDLRKRGIHVRPFA